jgi:hypothetical protein
MRCQRRCRGAATRVRLARRVQAACVASTRGGDTRRVAAARRCCQKAGRGGWQHRRRLGVSAAPVACAACAPAAWRTIASRPVHVSYASTSALACALRRRGARSGVSSRPGQRRPQTARAKRKGHASAPPACAHLAASRRRNCERRCTPVRSMPSSRSRSAAEATEEGLSASASLPPAVPLDSARRTTRQRGAGGAASRKTATSGAADTPAALCGVLTVRRGAAAARPGAARLRAGSPPNDTTTQDAAGAASGGIVRARARAALAAANLGEVGSGARRRARRDEAGGRTACFLLAPLAPCTFSLVSQQAFSDADVAMRFACGGGGAT